MAALQKAPDTVREGVLDGLTGLKTFQSPIFLDIPHSSFSMASSSILPREG